MKNNMDKYVPVLNWTRPAQIAISKLDNSIKEKVLPLIEIPKIPFDWEKNKQKKTIDDHLSNVPITINTIWGSSNVFLDTTNIEEEGALSSGQNSIDYLVRTSKKLNSHIIPVIRLNSKEPKIEVIKKLLYDKVIENICFRIEEKSFDKLNMILEEYLKSLSIPSSKCYLIIDLKEKHLDSKGVERYYLKVMSIVNNLINLSEWMSIIIIMTSFPKTLSDLDKNSANLIERNEYRLWKKIQNNKNMKRKLCFGDYNIKKYEDNNIDFRKMGISGNLRYTLDEKYLVYKGINGKKYGFKHMKQICEKLIHSKYYLGKSFSWGDKYIYDVAVNDESTGIAETWTRVGINHHITFVVKQISNFLNINYD